MTKTKLLSCWCPICLQIACQSHRLIRNLNTVNNNLEEQHFMGKKRDQLFCYWALYFLYIRGYLLMFSLTDISLKPYSFLYVWWWARDFLWEWNCDLVFSSLKIRKYALSKISLKTLCKFMQNLSYYIILHWGHLYLCSSSLHTSQTFFFIIPVVENNENRRYKYVVC